MTEAEQLRRLERLGAKAARAREELEEAIVDASSAGLSLRKIADAAGTNHEAVRQLLRRRAER